MPNIKGLYAIVDNNVELAHLILMGRCKILQLRMKDNKKGCLWRQDVFETARKIMKFKRQFDFTFIINDYVDVAGEVSADGVHVGFDDMPVNEVRRRIGDKTIIGYSSHSIDEAIAAERLGADYIAFGAIFPTKTKGPGHPVQGVEKLRLLRNRITKPLVAIGGINRSNIDSVLATGTDAVAMITGITEAKDVVEETRWYAQKCRQF